MKKGYCTLYSDMHDEIAWRDEDGNPIIYRTKKLAQEEIADDAREYKRQVKEGERSKEEVPEKDTIAWAIQLNETQWQIQNLDREDLFIWDITKL